MYRHTDKQRAEERTMHQRQMAAKQKVDETHVLLERQRVLLVNFGRQESRLNELGRSSYQGAMAALQSETRAAAPQFVAMLQSIVAGAGGRW